MGRSTPLGRRLSFLFVVIVGAFILSVGCAPSGTGGSAVALTAPSPVSAGASASLSQLSTIGTQAGPGAGYDATGLWDGVLTLLNGDPFGEGVLALTQDGNGNITGTGVPVEEDPGTYTFTRISATGGTIVYRFSITSPDPPGPECARNLSGLAQLHTRTNTIEVHRVAGTIDDCSNAAFSITLTKQ